MLHWLPNLSVSLQVHHGRVKHCLSTPNTAYAVEVKQQNNFAANAHGAWYFTHFEAHNDAFCPTINHKSTTVDVPTIEGPLSDGTNFG